MKRLARAWRAMEPEQHFAALAAAALLVSMFFPWYGLQSLNRRSGAIYSHSISAFGDVSFVEAAIFLVAIGVSAMLIARAEGRVFQMPGGDGTVVMLAGAWAALLIFYRVFSRPSGDGYPVGIEWGFFLAFVAAGALAFSGWRMRTGERPQPPLTRPRGSGTASPSPFDADAGPRGPLAHRRSAPVPAREPAGARESSPGGQPARAPYPPAPSRRASEPEQLSFEDSPRHSSDQ